MNTTGLYPNGTNTQLDLISDPTAIFFDEASFRGPVATASIFDGIYATSLASVNSMNAQAKGNFETQATEWLTNASLQRSRGLPIDPKPIAPLAAIILRVDKAGVGMWLKDAKGDPLGISPELPPAPDPNAPRGSITTPGGLTNDQQFANLRGLVSAARAESAAAKIDILAAIKALKA